MKFKKIFRKKWWPYWIWWPYLERKHFWKHYWYYRWLCLIFVPLWLHIVSNANAMIVLKKSDHIGMLVISSLIGMFYMPVYLQLVLIWLEKNGSVIFKCLMIVLSILVDAKMLQMYIHLNFYIFYVQALTVLLTLCLFILWV